MRRALPPLRRALPPEPVAQRRRLVEPPPGRKALPPPAGRKPLHIQQEPPDDRRDARRWRALTASARMRVVTEAHQPHTHPLPGSKYMLIELWSDHETPTTHLSLGLLVSYADHIIATKGVK